MYSLIVHRIHIYGYRLLSLLLLTVYAITVLLLAVHRPSILGNRILIVITELNNNLNGQITPELGKLMETSVFWVDLG